MSERTRQPDEEARVGQRSKLLRIVDLYSNGQLCASDAKIKNISPSGALVELNTPPAVGSTVTIRRADQEIIGVCVWADLCKCGIEFNSHQDIHNWLPEQVSVKKPFDERSEHLTIQQRIGEELECIMRILDSVSGILNKNYAIVNMYKYDLSNLEISRLTIQELSDVLKSENIAQAAGNIKMDSLKRRLLRRSL